jgi:hypothetical protein
VSVPIVRSFFPEKMLDIALFPDEELTPLVSAVLAEFILLFTLLEPVFDVFLRLVRIELTSVLRLLRLLMVLFIFVTWLFN